MPSPFCLRLLRSFLPARHTVGTEVREVYPYVHCQSTPSPFSPKTGRTLLNRDTIPLERLRNGDRIQATIS